MDANQSAYSKSIQALTGSGQNFELIRHKIDDIEYSVYKNAPNTLLEVYLAATEHGEREFLIYEGERWTFDKVFQQAWSIADALETQHSIVPGDRVGIAMRNYPEWLSVFTAITAMGAVAVPINSWGKADELLFAARDSDCKTVFCDQQRFD